MTQNNLNKLFILLLLVILSLGYVNAQVTIGSDEAPVRGALLDLKQETSIAPGGITAVKGLGMPRVKLLHTTIPSGGSLAQTIDGNAVADNWNANEHVGLLVYHTDKCTLRGKGLYVWTGNEWQPLHKQNTYTPALSQTYMDLPSGTDARGAIPVTPYNLTIAWQGGTNPTWDIAAAPGSTPLTLNSPIAGIIGSGTVNTSPFNLAILPTAMVIADSDKPWQSNESIITFTNLATECGQQNEVTLNQTNYALKVNNQFTNSQIKYTTAASGNFPVQGNAAWKTAVTDPNGILTPSTTIPANGGTDVKVTTTSPPTETITYGANNIAKYYTANITFSDTASVKRFNDITVSILDCNNVSEPSMSEWAARAGFLGVAFPKVSDADDIAKGINTPNPTTGIAWHRDQDGNIFLSASFDVNDPTGDSERWMITNLAARTYAPGIVNPYRNLIGATYNSGNASNVAYWGFPNKNETSYDNNPRVGLLYTWDAATAGKGQINGIGNGTNEGGSDIYPRVQGICPNGWYLPSDYEWTVLENQIIYRTATYSGTPNINATNPNVLPQNNNMATELRGTHGAAMKDACPAPAASTATNGSSNVISTLLRGGFSAILTGYAAANTASSYGTSALFWSSSSFNSTGAWFRSMFTGDTGVSRGGTNRYVMISVRCKR